MGFNLQSLLWSKRPDNLREFGLLWWSLAFVAAGGAIVWYTVAGEKAAEKIESEGATGSRVHEAIQAAGPVEEPAPETRFRSERDFSKVTEVAQTQPGAGHSGPPGESPSQRPRNALDEAAAEVSTPPPPAPAYPQADTLPGAIDYSDRPDLGTDSSPEPRSDGTHGTAPGGRNGGISSHGGPVEKGNTWQALISYGQKPAVDQQPAAKSSGRTTVAAERAAPTKSHFTEGRFLPRGMEIDLYLLEFIRTDMPQPLIVFGVAKDVRVHGKLLIPFGTHVLASVAGSPGQGTRVMVTPSSFQFLNLQELAVSGVVKDEFRMTGLEGVYIPPPMWVQMSGYVNDFLAGYLNMLYDRQKQLSSIRIGSVSLGADTGFDPKLEALAATSDVIQKFATRNMDELQARYAPYLLVPPGTKAKMMLLAPVSIDDVGVDVAPVKMDQPSAAAAGDDGLIGKANSTIADAMRSLGPPAKSGPAAAR